MQTIPPPVSDGGYRVLPVIYDQWQNSYGKDYSTLILPRLLQTLRAFDIPRGTMLDLACGTGTLAMLMGRRRWNVWGVDGSEGMLRAARLKPVPRGVRIQFVRQDMRSLRLPVPVDLATSMFDSINHLPREKDLLRTFQGVSAALRDGGWFVFDVNNERCFRRLWTGTATFQADNYMLILQNSYSPVRAAACSVVTLFLKHDQSWDRRQEVICERHYTRPVVAELLRRTGFVVREVRDFNFTRNPELGKIKTWWVAQKRVRAVNAQRLS